MTRHQGQDTKTRPSHAYTRRKYRRVCQGRREVAWPSGHGLSCTRGSERPRRWPCSRLSRMRRRCRMSLGSQHVIEGIQPVRGDGGALWTDKGQCGGSWGSHDNSAGQVPCLEDVSAKPHAASDLHIRPQGRRPGMTQPAMLHKHGDASNLRPSSRRLELLAV